MPDKYQEVYDLLSDYKQKFLLKKIGMNNKETYIGVEVFSSAITMKQKVKDIALLLSGMGEFTVIGNTNTETITIK